MNFIKTELNDVYIIEPNAYIDNRGYFMETFKKNEFERVIGKVDFIQENESMSTKGVLRGLHYQMDGKSQAKLVRVIYGSVLDVAVDLRISSNTFGKYVAVELNDQNKRQLYIPRGFAHGFLVLSDTAIFSYKVDNVYSPQDEASIRYDDPTIGIKWPEMKEIKTSKKDELGSGFENAYKFDMADIKI